MSWVRTATAGLALAAGTWSQGAGAAEVKNVKATHLWPWGRVGISYEVVGTIATNDSLVVTATDRTKYATYSAASNMLSGDTGRAAGKHQVIWDLDKQGIRLQSTNVTFTVAYQSNAVPVVVVDEGPLYCVVDLSAGANATSYPVTYLDAPPSGGFNTDEYKTTKLVLRLIPPGAFQMCGSYQTTLTKPYYMGVFEVTQKQYELVTGGNPSRYKGDKRPVEEVSWNTIRGNTNWPASSSVSASSFMGRLRARTGLEFDLPTEAQWEYACRAGTTSDYNNGGNTTNDLNKLGRYYDNRSDGKGGYTDAHTTVGSYLPNAWGLYDMHGNVSEWCLDWYGNLADGATDPRGASSGSRRVYRGGSWGGSAAYCRSARRNYYTPSIEDYLLGFRLSRVLSAE